MKKLFLLLSVCLLSLSLVLVGVVLISAETPPSSGEHVARGTFGEFSWSFDRESGALTVTGEGVLARPSEKEAWRSFRNEIKSVTVGEGVTEIAYAAFSGYEYLESVTFPKSLRTLGQAAFAGCRRLTTVNFAQNGALNYINSEAFMGCVKLSSIDLPEGVTEIGDEAFADCVSLRSVSLPKTLTSVDAESFDDCPALERITVAEGNPIYQSVNDCLIHVEQKMLVRGCKNSVIPDGVGAIGHKAFSGCTRLVRIAIPESVEVISEYAFEVCSGLEQITFAEDGALKTIGDSAFSGCKKLTTVILPKSVQSIGRYAFSDCPMLDRVELAEDGVLETIGDGAFAYCTKLPSITIPRSVQTIGQMAFEYCSTLAQIDLSGAEKLTTIGDSAFRSCKKLTSITIPRSVTEIGTGILERCEALESITVESGNKAFRAVNNCLCKGQTLVAGCKTSVIPQDGSVRIIAERAFYGCTGLTSLTVPTSIQNVGAYAFSECTLLTRINISDLGAWCGIVFAGGSPMENDNAELWLNGEPLSGELVLPEHITVIQSYTLAHGPWTKVVIPSGVTEIGAYAFCGCTELSEVVIPDGVKQIGEGAFWACEKLARVTLPSKLNRICAYTFRHCSALTEIVIPSGVEYIEAQAFMECENLTSVSLPNGLRSIDHYAFMNCTSLQSIHLPDSLTSLGPAAFSGCESLVQVTVPGGVKRIQEHTFAGCQSLSSVVLGEGILWVGQHAFENCSALTTIAFPHSLTELRGFVFYKSEAIQTVCYCGTAEEWEAVRRDEKWLSDADEVRMVYHNYQCKKVDSKTHRDVCSLCGDKRAAEKHTWGAWMSKDAQQHEHVCDCGYAKQADHEWNEQNVCSACGFANPTEPTPAAGCASSFSGGALVLIPLIGGAAWITRRRKLQISPTVGGFAESFSLKSRGDH